MTSALRAYMTISVEAVLRIKITTLHLRLCLQEDVKRLRALADTAAGVTKDRVAARDALALARQLAHLDATPEQVRPAFQPLQTGT